MSHNAGDEFINCERRRSEERRRDFTPRDMHLLRNSTVTYVQVHCSVHVVVNSSGPNFGLTDVMRSRIGYVLIATSFCCYRAARTEGTIYWCMLIALVSNTICGKIRTRITKNFAREARALPCPRRVNSPCGTHPLLAKILHPPL